MIDKSYFSNLTGATANFKAEDIELDILQLGGSSYFKLIAGSFSWDFGAGVLFSNGKMRFKGVEFGTPNVSLAYDEKQNILTPTRYPYGFTKIGIGRINGDKGFQFTFGINAAKPSFTMNENFKIYKKIGSNTSELASGLNTEWRIGYTFGFDILF